MATKKRQAKKEAQKADRKNAAEAGITTARQTFASFLRKADPPAKGR